jgi:hypothetical protein
MESLFTARVRPLGPNEYAFTDPAEKLVAYNPQISAPTTTEAIERYTGQGMLEEQALAFLIPTNY